MGAWLGANGEAVYGTKPSSLKVDDEDVYLTEKTAGDEKYLYIFITAPRSSVQIPSDKLKDCCVLETGQPLSIADENGCTEVRIPESLFKDHSIVVLKANSN